MTTLHVLKNDELMKRVETYVAHPDGLHVYGANLVARNVWVRNDDDQVVRCDAYSLADADPTTDMLRNVGWMVYSHDDEEWAGGARATEIFLTEVSAWSELRRRLERVYYDAYDAYRAALKHELELLDAGANRC